MKKSLLNENLMMERLEIQNNLFYPLETQITAKELSVNNFGKELRIDCILELKFEGKKVKAIVELKNRTAPSVVEYGIEFLQRVKNFNNLHGEILVLCVPFLTTGIVNRLKETKLSGLDMNGNYFIISSELVAIRLDRKNEFKEQLTIKDIYSRNSSIVVRYLLSEKQIKNNLKFISNNLTVMGIGLSLGTISKVLRSLEDELLIIREEENIKVIQTEMLLEKLAQGYRKPEVIEKKYLKLPEVKKSAIEILNQILGVNNWIWAGESSAELYTTTTTLNKFKVYIKSNAIDSSLIEKYVDNKFYNYEINYVKEKYVFFNAKNNYASKIQTYLEMSKLDKREKEIAEDIKRSIIND